MAFSNYESHVELVRTKSAAAQSRGLRVVPCFPGTISEAIELHRVAYEKWQAAQIHYEGCGSEKEAAKLLLKLSELFDDYCVQRKALLGLHPASLEDVSKKAFALLLHHDRDPFDGAEVRAILASFILTH